MSFSATYGRTSRASIDSSDLKKQAKYVSEELPLLISLTSVYVKVNWVSMLTVQRVE